MGVVCEGGFQCSEYHSSEGKKRNVLQFLTICVGLHKIQNKRRISNLNKRCQVERAYGEIQRQEYSNLKIQAFTSYCYELITC